MITSAHAGRRPNHKPPVLVLEVHECPQNVDQGGHVLEGVHEPDRLHEEKEGKREEGVTYGLVGA